LRALKDFPESRPAAARRTINAAGGQTDAQNALSPTFFDEVK
jgi:hypothetical protein